MSKSIAHSTAHPPAPAWSRPLALLLLLVLLVLQNLSGWAAPSKAMQPAELEARDSIRTNVRQRLSKGDFAGLEALAERYRASRERTASGVWHLAVFYHGIRELARLKADDIAGWKRLEKRLSTWQARYPYSPTPIIAKAVVLKRYAYAHRPQRLFQYIAETPEAVFVAELMAAKNFLERHKSVAENDPHYFVVWGELASALGLDEAEILATLDEGLVREPSYYSIYFTAVGAFGPQVSGDGKALEALANMAVARTEPTEGLSVYARIYWYLSQQPNGPGLMRETAFDLQRLDRGIDDLLDRYPDPWNISGLARLACLAGAKEKAASLIERLQSQPEIEGLALGSAEADCRP